MSAQQLRVFICISLVQFRIIVTIVEILLWNVCRDTKEECLSEEFSQYTYVHIYYRTYIHKRMKIRYLPLHKFILNKNELIGRDHTLSWTEFGRLICCCRSVDLVLNCVCISYLPLIYLPDIASKSVWLNCIRFFHLFFFLILFACSFLRRISFISRNKFSCAVITARAVKI